jgi:hypothetical protein
MQNKTLVMWDEEARDQVLRFLSKLPLNPLKPTVIEVRPYEEAPSDDQRGYYQTVVLNHLCDHTGYRKHEMHEFLRQEFGPKAHIEVGRIKRDVSTFTTSNKGSMKLMAVFLDIVIAFARDELGVIIPPPTTQEERA